MKTPNTIAFQCEKQPASASRGMVVTNHPLASSAGAQMLLEGGNAIDAAVAALFALTVVEPMMVGVLGGGLAHLRTAEGEHTVIDGLSTAPGAARADMYEALSTELATYRDTRDQANLVGPLAIAVPGALRGWCELLDRHGTMRLPDVMEPAIRYARRGFVVTPYLSTCVAENSANLARDAGLASLFLPGAAPISAGSRLVRAEYAASLEEIARLGAAALHDGPLGEALERDLEARGGIVTRADLAAYAVKQREVVRGSYRGFEIAGPPPPSSSGVHIVQMLNILEGFDVGALGFGSAASIHLLAEALSIAFADRAVATADPDFVDVPVATLTSKSYAAERRAAIDPTRARSWRSGLPRAESPDTTHVTVADASGNVVCSTQTINSLFGACVQIAGTGMLANNYMFNFDPHPGSALSIAPGKRVFTSMAPMMVLQDDRVRYALGLPGGLRIFPSALQAIVNLIDHRMSLQEAVEAPRVWTEGGVLELEPAIDGAVADALAAMGHRIVRVPRVAGGMNAIEFDANGRLHGAACWRADGTPVGVAGGLARKGVGFSIA
ncbi:MAG: gamma-glutamyltransferase [Burkholderiaceae bacterium]|nr:gamma-glutamyltransferase [Burkholderiaceae bacterium]